MGHDGCKINLLDTPGTQTSSATCVPGCAPPMPRCSSSPPPTASTARPDCSGKSAQLSGMPRAVVVTKVDAPRADFDEVLADAQEAFGEGVMPLYLPMLGDDESVADSSACSRSAWTTTPVGKRVERDAEPQHQEIIEQPRNDLIEAIIAESEDETLMDRYLSGEDVELDTLIGDLETAVARGSFFPVIPVASTTGMGLPELLELVTRGFPSPTEHAVPPVATPSGDPRGPLSADPSGPLVAEVVKTVTDPYVGRVSLVRVFSGTLRPDAIVHVSGHGLEDRGHEDHDVDEKIGALSSPLGKTQRPLAKAIAGEVCAVSKLSRAETGDTLSDKDNPLLMQPWLMPEPLLPVAIVAHTKADEDKLSQGLGRLVAEDPTMRLEQNPDTHQLVIWAMGEAHIDVLLDRLANRYGVVVDQEPLKVALRETFAGSAKGHGRHVKQSGGHGQFAVCDIEVEPLTPGSGFEFVDKVVGGAVPRQFIPSVEKGIRAQMERGVTAGYPVVDLRVTLTDGKAHSVDSSDMAFQMAGGLALKEAAAQTSVSMLEPVDEIAILIDDDYVGSVMSDLSGRRGHVVGTEPVGHGRTLVRADVPQLEIMRYAIDLRAMSHGTGTFTRQYRRHDPMPANIAAKLAAS